MRIDSRLLFLLYVRVMLVITFLQQAFVLLPGLQNIDIIGEESKMLLLERYQKQRWVAFCLVPVLLLLRLLLVSLCLFLGGFFFEGMRGKSFGEWWRVAMIAQLVMLLYGVILCGVNIVFGPDKSLEFTQCTSLCFLGGNDIEAWVRIPLAAVNIFEILYWIMMSLCVGKLCGTKYGISFKFVMFSYGTGYLFYITLIMFLMLYLT